MLEERLEALESKKTIGAIDTTHLITYYTDSNRSPHTVTYVATKDCWICGGVQSQQGNGSTITLDDNVINFGWYREKGVQGQIMNNFTLPVHAGQVLKITTSNCTLEGEVGHYSVYYYVYGMLTN